MEEVEAKKRVEQSEEPGMRLARLVSEITNPLFVALPTFLMVALRTAPTILQAFVWWIVTCLGITLAPLLFVRRGVRLGHYTDHHVSRREQRLIPMFFAIACLVIVFVCLYLLHASAAMMATVVGALVACLLATGITKFWKISLHLVGIAGAVTAFGLVLGPVFFLLAPLVLLVAWARWRVGAHTPAQALAGTVLAVSVTVVIFWLFQSR